MRQCAVFVLLLLLALPAGADVPPVAALPGGMAVSGPPAAAHWQPVREVSGVPVEARPTETGFDVHRAQVQVCTDLDALEAFVVDATRFADWVAFTRSARLLERSDESAIYYVRSTTPWPMQDRDMVYRIARTPAAVGLRLSLTGLPDYAPPTDNAMRIRSASGEWRLVPGEAGIDVTYELYLDPGRVPRYLANQRLATAVGQTLANLAARFPCHRG